MTKNKLNKQDAELRYELAKAIYDFDDGKLTKEKLQNLQYKITNKISGYIEFSRGEEKPSMLTTVESKNSDGTYTDDLFLEDDYEVEDILSEICNVVDEMTYKYKPLKELKKDISNLEKQFKAYKKHLGDAIKYRKKNIVDADKCLKEIKDDIQKDLKKSKSKKIKSKTLLSL